MSCEVGFGAWAGENSNPIGESVFACAEAATGIIKRAQAAMIVDTCMRTNPLFMETIPGNFDFTQGDVEDEHTANHQVRQSLSLNRTLISRPHRQSPDINVRFKDSDCLT